jgi:hypothetical protein
VVPRALLGDKFPFESWKYVGDQTIICVHLGQSQWSFMKSFITLNFHEESQWSFMKSFMEFAVREYESFMWCKKSFIPMKLHWHSYLVLFLVSCAHETWTEVGLMDPCTTFYGILLFFYQTGVTLSSGIIKHWRTLLLTHQKQSCIFLCEVDFNSATNIYR